VTGPDAGLAATAETVFARVAAEAEDIGPASSPEPLALPPDPLARLRDGLAASLHLFTDMVLQAVDGVLAATAQDERPAGPLVLRLGPGRAASAPVWIHNLGEAAVEGTVLRLTRCTAPDGTELDGVDAGFEPAKIDVGAGASECVTVTVALSPAAAAGSYVGHVVASGLPGSALPVQLVVGP